MICRSRKCVKNSSKESRTSYEDYCKLCQSFFSHEHIYLTYKNLGAAMFLVLSCTENEIKYVQNNALWTFKVACVNSLANKTRKSKPKPDVGLSETAPISNV